MASTGSEEAGTFFGGKNRPLRAPGYGGQLEILRAGFHRSKPAAKYDREIGPRDKAYPASERGRPL
jgi:hypothetical protein